VLFGDFVHVASFLLVDHYVVAAGRQQLGNEVNWRLVSYQQVAIDVHQLLAQVLHRFDYELTSELS
jgi:hypothetical protein